MKLTLEKLAQLTGGKVLRGDSCVEFTGVASLKDATGEEISFLGNEKYFNDFLKTKAGAVIIPAGVPEFPAEEVALLEISGNPSVAFNEAVKYFLSATRRFVPGVHPTAVVDPTAEFNPEKVSIGPHAVIGAYVVIGDGCEIAAGCFLGDAVVMGENCKLHPHVVIRERCRLGKCVVIQPNATIGSDGFGYQLVDGRFVGIDQVGIVELADYVEIGANSTIDRARFGKTIIGQDSKIDNLVQIGHNCVVGEHTIIVAQSGIAGSTRVGDYVTIAAQCGISGHLNLGDGITLAAKSGVMGDLEGGKGQIYWGMPCSLFRDASRQFSCMRKLPQMVKDFKALTAEVEKLRKDKTEE